MYFTQCNLLLCDLQGCQALTNLNKIDEYIDPSMLNNTNKVE